MGFGGSGGSGGSIASSSDVSLSNPATDEYLGYDTSVGKWQNKGLSGKVALANGGGMEGIVGLSVNSTNATLDLSQGNVFRVHAYHDPTFVFSGGSAVDTAASAFSLYMTYMQTSVVVTWPTNVKWPGGTAPTLTLTVNATDILVFETVDGGVTWYGAVAGLNY